MSWPVNLALTQRFSRPERQYRQVPSVQPSQGTPTRSPSANPPPPLPPPTTPPPTCCPPPPPPRPPPRAPAAPGGGGCCGGVGPPPLKDVQVRTTDPADRHLDQDL